MTDSNKNTTANNTQNTKTALIPQNKALKLEYFISPIFQLIKYFSAITYNYFSIFVSEVLLGGGCDFQEIKKLKKKSPLFKGKKRNENLEKLSNLQGLTKNSFDEALASLRNDDFLYGDDAQIYFDKLIKAGYHVLNLASALPKLKKLGILSSLNGIETLSKSNPKLQGLKTLSNSILANRLDRLVETKHQIQTITENFHDLMTETKYSNLSISKKIEIFDDFIKSKYLSEQLKLVYWRLQDSNLITSHPHAKLIRESLIKTNTSAMNIADVFYKLYSDDLSKILLTEQNINDLVIRIISDKKKEKKLHDKIISSSDKSNQLETLVIDALSPKSTISPLYRTNIDLQSNESLTPLDKSPKKSVSFRFS